MVYDLLHPSKPLTPPRRGCTYVDVFKKINAHYLLSFSGANP